MAGAGLCDERLLCGVDSLPESSSRSGRRRPRGAGDRGEAAESRSASEEEEAASSPAFFRPRAAEPGGRPAGDDFGDDLGRAVSLSEDLAGVFGVDFPAAVLSGVVGVAGLLAADADFLADGVVLAPEPFSAGRLAGRLSAFPPTPGPAAVTVLLVVPELLTEDGTGAGDGAAAGTGPP